MSNIEFSSEGFDLDALAGSAPIAKSSSGDDDNVVYEIGGGVTVDTTAQKPQENNKTAENDESKTVTEKAATKTVSGVMDEADEAKENGNAAFKDGNWLEAYDCYTAAILATPGDVSGEQLLKLRDDWREEQIKEQRRRMDRQEEERRQKQLQKRQREKNKKESNGSDDNKKDDNTADADDDQQDEAEEQHQQQQQSSSPPRFEPPPHVHGTKLAVFYANRAATLLHLQRYEAAVRDCDVALLYNPVYTKAYLRRASAQESLQQTEDALLDAKSALSVSTDAAERQRIQKLLSRLQKLEDERLERLKAETMDKLKDLGNSILGNFGLSLDNFQTVQDPKTGSYSISFNQGNKK
jgi:tetratricopeptide (TPR) repeat protein